MSRKKTALLAAAAALLALTVCLPFMRGKPLSAQPSSMQNAARTQSPDGMDTTLFPSLDEAAITAISVSTPERSFHFLREGANAVSVNGQQADAEIFSTLLEQIADLPVNSFTAFSPCSSRLQLTLVVSTAQAQHTAHFYAGGASGETTHIISGSCEAPAYSQTNGWRVGTLMMTCEGTRIQDAHGNETPL